MKELLKTVSKIDRVNTITNTICLASMVGLLTIGAVKGFKSLTKSVSYIK